MTYISSPPDGMLRSPAFKFFLIGFLILLLLVPLVMVMALVSERTVRALGVQDEISRYWGGPQQIAGPYLIVPYTVRVETKEGDKTVMHVVERRAVFLPDDLAIVGASKASVLHRSIYDVNVYTSDLTIEGKFGSPDMTAVDPDAVSVRWKDAVLALAIEGVSGLKEAAVLEVEGGESIPFAPSVGVATSRQNGIHAKLASARSIIADPEVVSKPFSFKIPLKLTGSRSMRFAPAARETRVALSSDWPHPSFSGAFLPAEREVRADGFKASWKVPHLARSVPPAWELGNDDLRALSPYMFGVDYYAPVDFYDMVERAVKYALLFLALGFMGVFILELLSKRRVHPVQYLFVGLAMVFFYVLLLSLSEHIGFSPAYLVASAATGGMLSLYVGKALRSMRSGLAMLALFLATYGFLYFILQLEDYALLAGALLGFSALTAVMFATIDIEWSQSVARHKAHAGGEAVEGE